MATPTLIAGTNLSPGRHEIFDWYLTRFQTVEREILIESTHLGDPLHLEALLHAVQRGVQVLWLHDPSYIPIFAYEAKKYRDELAHDRSLTSRYSHVFRLCTELQRYSNFCYATVAAHAATPLPADAHLLASRTGRGNNVALSLHSKLSVFDSEHLIVGSANHIDISFHDDRHNGHTEAAFGISCRSTAQAVLDKVARFYLFPHQPLDDERVLEVLHDTRQPLVSRLIARARDNQTRWLAGQAIDGSIVAIDIAWWIHDSPIDGSMKMFANWQ